MSESNVDKTIAIFTATHVPFEAPNNPIYIPLHVGREGKEELGYIGDNIGENISELNYLFGELTGLFWIWRNIHNMDYVGLCHYRRYFLNDDGELLGKKEYLDYLSKYDVIVPRSAEAPIRYYDYYGEAHDAKYLDVIGDAINTVTPEYYEYYKKAMDGRTFFSGNLMVTRKEIMDDYSNWLFTVFFEAFDKIDVSGYDSYHKRIYGFLSEQMLYVYMMRHNLSYRETIVGISDEKDETRQLKLNLQNLINENKYNEAYNLFCETYNRRPDILLPGSDLYGELGRLWQDIKGHC